MARRIVEDGFPLTVWGRRPQTVEAFGDTSAAIVSSPAEVGAASDIVAICVFSDEDVKDVVLRSDGVLAGLSPGGLVAIHSTVHPRTCAEIADQASARGVTVIDAPVSGGAAAAEERRLLVMAGGEEQDVDRCRPVFDTFADPIVHLGPLGSGQMAKAINNLLLAAHMALAIDAFSFAGELGVDQLGLARALAEGSGGSKAADIIANSDFEFDDLRRDSSPYFRKDIPIMVDIANYRMVPEPQFLIGAARRALLNPTTTEVGLPSQVLRPQSSSIHEDSSAVDVATGIASQQ